MFHAWTVEDCNPGRYGINCQHKCSERCTDTCDALTGSCSCEQWWTGKQCAVKIGRLILACYCYSLDLYRIHYSRHYSNTSLPILRYLTWSIVSNNMEECMAYAVVSSGLKTGVPLKLVDQFLSDIATALFCVESMAIKRIWSLIQNKRLFVECIILVWVDNLEPKEITFCFAKTVRLDGEPWLNLITNRFSFTTEAVSLPSDPPQIRSVKESSVVIRWKTINVTADLIENYQYEMEYKEMSSESWEIWQTRHDHKLSSDQYTEETLYGLMYNTEYTVQIKSYREQVSNEDETGCTESKTFKTKCRGDYFEYIYSIYSQHRNLIFSDPKYPILHVMLSFRSLCSTRRLRTRNPWRQ